MNTSVVSGLEISCMDGKHYIQLPEVFSQETIPVIKENIPCQDDADIWPYLKEVKIPTIKAEVGLFIGANVSKAKRYGVIFTCLAIRAVHLEVAPSLDTDACLNAIRRFIARRGQVKEMYSKTEQTFDQLV